MIAEVDEFLDETLTEVGHVNEKADAFAVELVQFNRDRVTDLKPDSPGSQD